VQPDVALGKNLIAAGHDAAIGRVSRSSRGLVRTVDCDDHSRASDTRRDSDADEDSDDGAETE